MNTLKIYFFVLGFFLITPCWGQEVLDCNLTEPQQLVKQLGTDSFDDFKAIYCLAKTPYKSIGLLINELRPIKETYIWGYEENPVKNHPEAMHVMMCICGLRFITGGMDFQATSSYRFKKSEEERCYFLHNYENEPKSSEGIFKDPNLKFFAVWMSRGTRFIAPQDAQSKIIKKWREWYAEISPNTKFQPLQNPEAFQWLF
jgi:hypothetical protein